MDFYTIIGIIGMCAILVAFLLNQMNIWKQDMLSYDTCNAIGSVLLIAYAYNGKVWPFVILNTVWAAYSLKDVMQKLLSTAKTH